MPSHPPTTVAATIGDPATQRQAPSSLGVPLLNPHQTWWSGLGIANGRAAQTLLESERSGGRHQSSVYELFSEMEEKDGHLYSLLQTRLNGLLGLNRELHAGGDSDTDHGVVEFVARAIERLPRFEALLRALLDGVAKGFAVVELLWAYDASGRLVVADWIAHPQEYFLFDDRGQLRLLAPPFADASATTQQPTGAATFTTAGRTMGATSTALVPPERKFLALVFGRDARNPYGRGLCQRAYWYYWFKKNTLRFWAIYNEKFGAPTAVATYRPGTSDDERRKLLDVLDSLQSDAGVVVPESVTLRLLESGSRGDGSKSFAAMANFCNDEMARIVLGATLTSGEGNRSGSLALGNVHNSVRQDYIEADARLLAEAINGTLVRWLVDLNFGDEVAAPRWVLDPTPPADLAAQIAIDRELLNIGVELPVSYFHERYGRRAARANEPTLSHDDSNLFQYHLRYGVLTINEVRERLHLAPVPWGNRPTSIERAGDVTPTTNPNSRNAPVASTAPAGGGTSLEEATRAEESPDLNEGAREADPHEP